MGLERVRVFGFKVGIDVKDRFVTVFWFGLGKISGYFWSALNAWLGMLVELRFEIRDGRLDSLRSRLG